jgi:hypothetical protein
MREFCIDFKLVLIIPSKSKTAYLKMLIYINIMSIYTNGNY